MPNSNYTIKPLGGNMLRQNPFGAVYAELNGNSDESREYPCCIDIELTNHCNLSCLMCPTGTGVAKREKGFMSAPLFSRILEDCKGKKVGLRFIRWGEPTLHPQLGRVHYNLLQFTRKYRQ
ncbi:hypothetical protein FACS1894139_02910 [Planctomycetales bacterium]|nr:hypothetical protein FACS1894107_11400 [Planctomycetales bacterium]GHT00693.1 hypothetical protein FACS1894108_13350 [Planctomycetales bacterium]GHT03195.1 hypothetical protein FACS1894139_02910 [Planctomycetales bacterium]